MLISTHNKILVYKHFRIRISQVALVVTNPLANEGYVKEAGSIPELGRSPRGRNDNPLQCSCLENPTEREAWQATVCGVAKRWTRLKQLGTHTFNTKEQNYKLSLVYLIYFGIFSFIYTVVIIVLDFLNIFIIL